MQGSIALEKKQLGKGAFGIVYLGFDINNNKYVALKKIPNEIVKDPQKINALGNEILISTDVSGDNLVKIRDIQEIQDSKYLVYEYCNGGDLRRYLSFFKRFDEHLVQICIRQILNGLCELHKKKIIHHDVKPENVLVVFDVGNEGIDNMKKYETFYDKIKSYTDKPKKGVLSGDVNIPNIVDVSTVQINDSLIERLLRVSKIKLSDFGLSKFGEEQQEKLLSGSPLYMSPEMFESNAKTENIENPKVDIWALGVLAYELYFGERPFNSSTGDLNGLIKSLKKGKYDINLERCYQISKPFLGFLNLCLQSNPNDRPTAEELLFSEFITAEVDSFDKITLDNFATTEFYINKNHPHFYKVPNQNKIFMDSQDQKFLATILEV